MSVSHDTVRIERTIAAPVERVFRAWQTTDALTRWYLPGDAGWQSEILEHEFAPGGRKRLTFGPAGEPPYSEDCRYEDIVRERRIVYTMTIAAAGVPLTASLVTIEMGGDVETRLVVTDQLAILDGADTAEARRTGWHEVLDKLASDVA